MHYVFLSLFLLISSSSSRACVGFSLDQVATGGGSGDSSACVQKLMPCLPYLQSPSIPPLPACCDPLKAIISSGNSTCLCEIFNNVVLLKSFNLTQDEALKLTKACGAKADISVCKTGASAPTPNPSNSSSKSNTPSGAASLVIPSLGESSNLVLMLFMVNLVLSAAF